MHLVIESKDFTRFTPATRQELLQVLTGKALEEAPARPRRYRYRWRVPFDLSLELTGRLLHGLANDHRKRLRVFAEDGGRAAMSRLLEATGDTDWRVLSYFQSVVNRKLRHLVGDEEKIAHLVGWDYDSARWNSEQTEIVDGVYYVTEKTARCLRSHFGLE